MVKLLTFNTEDTQVSYNTQRCKYEMRITFKIRVE